MISFPGSTNFWMPEILLTLCGKYLVLFGDELCPILFPDFNQNARLHEYGSY